MMKGWMSRIAGCALSVAVVALMAMLAGCNTVDDDRIPSYPVNLNLASPDLWSTYAPAAYGDWREFIRELREPRNFPYTEKSATGYGGVLLVIGLNPYTLEAGVPVAYDLSCPVEMKPDIRVRMQADAGPLPEAVCPECGSHYDVVEQGGAPKSGPALSGRLGLRRYECRQGIYGGYLILNI